MFVDEPAIGGAEYVPDPSSASAQIFILIFEERAGHFGPCGFSGGSIVASSGSFESFGVQRMPSPSLANLFSTHEFPKRVRWVPEPSDPNRQREKQDQHDSRHDGGRIFHYLSRDPDHGCPMFPSRDSIRAGRRTGADGCSTSTRRRLAPRPRMTPARQRSSAPHGHDLHPDLRQGPAVPRKPGDGRVQVRDERIPLHGERHRRTRRARAAEPREGP